MKIRTKLVGIVSVALLLPLLLGLFYIRRIGESYYLKQKGVLYLTIAKELSDAMEAGVRNELSHVRNWIEISPLLKLVQDVELPPLNMARVQRLESEWSDLSPDDEPLRTILSGPLAQHLNVFSRIYPVFAEIMVTDRFGCLIGATNPTTDYWQADEAWWKKTCLAGPGNGLMHEVKYDDSAGVLAIDLSFPLYDASGTLQGTLKTSLHATHLLQKLAPKPWNEMISRDISFSDGRLLLRLNQTDGVEELSRVRPEAMGLLSAQAESWHEVQLYSDVPSLAVAVPFMSSQDTGSLYMIVHRNLKSAMAPIDSVIREVSIGGAILVVVFAGISYLLAILWFARPLEKLRRTAQSMTRHIRLQEQGCLKEARESLMQAEEQLKALRSIKSRDELQELAVDFSQLGGRVLTFHHQLAQELTEKTEEMNADLLMAREFQEALLPQSYPEIPYPSGADPYRLTFNHIYYPALSISGDFFDISKISDHGVRILIADVMGHGARSALMTAILHTLIYSGKDSRDPACLLQSMNEEFYRLGVRTNETIFVTAVHMIIDTHDCTIRYAIAGHPPPIVIEHASGHIRELLPTGKEHPPAAGLIEQTIYKSSLHPISTEQTVLLYTDGAIEARSPKKVEFGAERLKQTVREAYEAKSLDRLPQYLIENLESFMDTAVALDDICLVSVDVTRS